jgi:RluA family pseudouridine synthase
VSAPSSTPKPPIVHRIRRDGDGMPLLAYLLRMFSSVPEAEFRRAVTEGCFSIRDDSEGDRTRLIGAEERLVAGEVLLARVHSRIPEDPFEPRPPDRMEVLFDDDHLYVVNKPPALLCYPLGVRTVAATTLAEAALEARGQPIGVRVLHRLDKDTSGALAFAKHLEADRRIKRMFAKRQVRKTYLALVRGRFPGGMQLVRARIGKDEGGPIRIRMRVDPKGRDAQTMFRLLSSFGDDDHGESGRGYSWVEARPLTGRTHQIRVHLASMGHPVVGDKLYIDDGRAFLKKWDGLLEQSDIDALGLPRHALHAWNLVFRHPMVDMVLRLRAPLASDLVEFAQSRGGDVPEPLPFPELP